MRKVVGSNPDDDLYRIASFSFAIDLERDCYETVKTGTACYETVKLGLLATRPQKPGLLETTSKCENKWSFESTFFELEVAPSTGKILEFTIY